MVYACLQLVARARETGISVLDLGKATKYDQKSCFYIVKQLVELGLMLVIFIGHWHVSELTNITTASNFGRVAQVKTFVFTNIFMIVVLYGRK